MPCLLARLSINTSHVRSIIRNTWMSPALKRYDSVPWFSDAWLDTARLPLHVPCRLSTCHLPCMASVMSCC